jgi:hypothetical protein
MLHGAWLPSGPGVQKNVVRSVRRGTASGIQPPSQLRQPATPQRAAFCGSISTPKQVALRSRPMRRRAPLVRHERDGRQLRALLRSCHTRSSTTTRVVKNLSARLVVHLRTVPAAAAIVCAVLIVACGSSNTPPADATGGPLLRLAQCMRAHDVPNFPDPSSTGGLIIPNDINTNAPAFRAAQRACAKLAQSPVGRGPSPESRRLQLLAVAKCMRSQGVANFADPTNSPPPPSSGNAIGGNGWYLPLGTKQERAAPRYKRAAAACGAQGF